MLKDSQQRLEATDPSQSFIVQAPAGSGKTELLTQRYLRLLSIVNAPEQIIALTFTKKAAREMADRIFLALKNADEALTPTTPHKQLTYNFAQAALKRSKTLNWQLLTNPARLRVMTIDALCQKITHAIPLQEKHLPYAKISENPLSYYKKAARACLSHALDDASLEPFSKQLLRHLDNRQDLLTELLANLLTNREQWLKALYSSRQKDKIDFEAMLKQIEKQQLSDFKNTLSSNEGDNLWALARQLAAIEACSQSPRFLLNQWQSYHQLTPPIVSALAALLLTSQSTLRRTFDHHVGLKRDGCEDKIYKQIKEQSKELLEKLALKEDFLEALLKIKSLPSAHYDEEQWQMLQALFTLLPLLVGYLYLEFAENNEVDFSAVAHQAMLALGTEEEPTDLALYFDNAISHFLIDEFQDTSLQQFELLEKLVGGWQPQDGRTLFLVGDPMQSIYRFRQAEVGLFLKAKQEGLASLRLKSLELSANFRSTVVIVEWINKQFSSIFPKIDKIDSGAISFHPSVHTNDLKHHSCIKAYQFANRLKEAAAIVKQIEKELANHPEDEIAILVRSRSQLKDIITLLRKNNIPFQGVEVERLATLSHIRDLWTLTQVLIFPANRLVWLALLRSPYCGLTLSDLHCIANFNRKKSIYYALSQLPQIKGLSEDAQIRLDFIFSVLNNALAKRYQLPFVEWVMSVFRQLQGDLILSSLQQRDLEQYWQLLDRFTAKGFFSYEGFKEDFDKLYSKRSTPSRLHIMTIHKSKGLEFDTVIIPSVGSKSGRKQFPLLRWLKIPSNCSDDRVLFSPIKAAYRENCLIYNFLGKLEEEKDHYELQRLLYVAVTRAKKRLYLYDNQDKEYRGSFRGLLKKESFQVVKTTIPKDNELSLPFIYQLPLKNYFYSPLLTRANQSALKPFSLENNHSLEVITQELIGWLCKYHPKNFNELPWELIANRFKFFGFDQDWLAFIEQLKVQIKRLLDDPIGQWICQAHDNEINSYPLLIKVGNSYQHRIIKRSFIDQGYRWIIDFKTEQEEKSANDFHLTINAYASLVSFTKIPIRYGIYYLNTNTWLYWDHQEKRKDLPMENV